MKAQVMVKLKHGVLDPQGKAIEGSLHTLGFADVAAVRQGKMFDIELKTEDSNKAREILDAISKKLLANTVIEDFEIRLV